MEHKTRIWVSGSKGQLGQSIRELSHSFPGLYFDFTDVEELDILDLPAVRLFVKSNRPDYIINCAAYTHVDNAEKDTIKAFQINADGPGNLQEAAKTSQARLIHISTDYVFNGRNYKPYTEEDIADPESAYGISKLKGEMILANSPFSLIIRTSWLYSEYGNNFLKTVLRLARENDRIRMVCDQTGTPTYASDLGDAILRIINICAQTPGLFIPGLFHYSNEGTASWYDFAKEIVHLSGMKTEVVPIETHEYPLPAKRPYYSVLNKRKIRNTFGISIRHWKDALMDCSGKMGLSPK